MKKLILVLFAFVSLNVDAQVNSLDSVNITETERIIDKYSGKLATSITSLAEILKVPASHVYGIMVKNQFLNGVSIFIVCCFLILADTTSIVPLFFSEEYRREFWGLPFIITIVVAFFLLIFIPDAISQTFNPEYGAIKEIMNFVK
jgi:hypothetical protein